MKNLMDAYNTNMPEFNSSHFQELIHERCCENEASYREELRYFFHFYKHAANKSNERLEYFNSTIERADRDEILRIIPLMIEAKLAGIHASTSISDDDWRTLWLNEKDDLGLSTLAHFEDKINDIYVYYDLDESDRDLDLLRSMNEEFTKQYYKAKERSAGVDALDTFFASKTAYEFIVESAKRADNAEVQVLVARIGGSLRLNAYYNLDLNKVSILAPLMFPVLTDNSTLNKNYNLFNTIGHEIFHSVVNTTWAAKSSAFKNGMECLIDHYRRTCDVFGVGVCESGNLTFMEDGPDVEGLRINYEFLKQNHRADLMELVYTSESFSVNREQALFYLFGIDFCSKIGQTCNLFGPESK